jgi:regulator of replication initiation timing
MNESYSGIVPALKTKIMILEQRIDVLEKDSKRLLDENSVLRLHIAGLGSRGPIHDVVEHFTSTHGTTDLPCLVDTNGQR